MIIPIRCFSCGKVIGSKYLEYKNRVEKGENPKEVLDSLGITRYCCRRMILSHVELLKEASKFD
jgi:DNA-directed RNA polymerase subunit N